MNQHTEPQGLHADQQALLAVLAQLLQPLARLCLAKGMAIQTAEEVLRRAYVNAALHATGEPDNPRLTSRLSTMTGLTRREVDRLRAMTTPTQPTTRSVATEVLTYWATQSDYVNKKGKPLRLARTGDAPSFEALAASVTKDVHPKSILADMVRLGLVIHHEKNDTVALSKDMFVPQGDWPQLVGFMGTNVGDHLQASVDNVLGDGREHFEQALLADELSHASLQSAKALITAQWRELLTQLGPQLQALMDQDRALGRERTQQLRIGLYTYMRAMQDAQPGPDHQPSKE
jgi:hypothetical protein